VKVTIPYGNSFQEFILKDFNKITIFEPHETPAVKDEKEAIKNSLLNPIGSQRLSKMIKSKKSTVAIIVNDITRPTPSESFLNALMEELNIAGINEDNIRVIIATGSHRPNTKEELSSMIGKENLKRFYVENHDCQQESKLKYIGKTKNNLPIVINKTVAESDIRILTGVIAPHHTAGFSGGRKSILPGVAGFNTLKIHHSLPIRPYYPAMGMMTKNPFHEISLEVAKKVGVDFILNAVQNSKKETIAVVAGDLEHAHEIGVNLCRKNSEIKVEGQAEIVITSPGGFPRDINLYQSQKAVSVAEKLTKDKGVIILVAECQKGVEKGNFLEWMLEAKEPKEVIDRFIEEGYSIGSNKAFMFARALSKNKIIVVTDNISEEILNKMFMEKASSLDEAVNTALKYCGKDSKIYCLPKAINIIPKVEDNNDNY